MSMVRVLICLVPMLVGFYLGPLQVVGSSLTHLPGDLVDSRFNNYILEHGYLTVGHGKFRTFWHAPFCYPARWVTACSDAHLGNVPIYSIYRYCGAIPERAYQLWWLTTFPLTYFASWYAARRSGCGMVGAMVAAVMFTYSPTQLGNLGHAQMFPRYFVPLSLVFTWEFLTVPRSRTLALALLCWVAQIYCTVYLGYFLAWLMLMVFIAAAATGAVAWQPLLRPSGREWGQRSLVVLATLLMLWPTLRPYFAPDRNQLTTSPDTVLAMLPEPLDWIRPSSTAWAWQSLREEVPEVSPPTFSLFPGGFATVGFVASLCLLIVGWISPIVRRSPLSRRLSCFALATLLLGLFVMRYGDFCPYSSVMNLPLVSGVRATFRVSLVLVWPMALAAGLLIEQLWERCEARPRAVRILFLLTLCVLVQLDVMTRSASQVPDFWRYELREAVARREVFASELRRYPDLKFFYLFPGPDTPDPMAPLMLQMDAMCAAQMLGVPTVNGWTGQWPPGWFAFQDYSSLYAWLQPRGLLTPEAQRGFHTFGQPSPPPLSPLEAEFRAKLPIHPWP